VVCPFVAVGTMPLPAPPREASPHALNDHVDPIPVIRRRRQTPEDVEPIGNHLKHVRDSNRRSASGLARAPG
jgi:hypothetical protein